MAESAGLTPFAAWLNQQISDSGMSQAAVARYVGTDGVQVMRWRRSEATPTPRFLAKLADLFGSQLADLERLAYLPDSSALPASRQVEIERSMWHAVYDELIEKEVPRPMWQAYIDACMALARAFRHITPAALNTDTTAALNKPAGNSEGGSSDPERPDLMRHWGWQQHAQQFDGSALSGVPA